MYHTGWKPQLSLCKIGIGNIAAVCCQAFSNFISYPFIHSPISFMNNMCFVCGVYTHTLVWKVEVSPILRSWKPREEVALSDQLDSARAMSVCGDTGKYDPVKGKVSPERWHLGGIWGWIEVH